MDLCVLPRPETCDIKIQKLKDYGIETGDQKNINSRFQDKKFTKSRFRDQKVILRLKNPGIVTPTPQNHNTEFLKNSNRDFMG